MATPETRNKPKLTVDEAAEALNLILLGQDAPCTYEEAFEILSKTNVENMEVLNRTQYKFSEFGEYVVVIQNVRKITIKGQEVTVVELLNEKGEEFINWDKMLVTAAEGLETLPTFVKVVYDKDIPSGKGNPYKHLKVYGMGQKSKDKSPF